MSRTGFALTIALLVCCLGFAGERDFKTLAADAEAARNAGRIEEAISLYRQALAQRSNWSEGWFGLGTLLYEREQFLDATTAFEKATALSPKVGTAWVMLALSEYKLRRNGAALQHIQKGRQLGTVPDPQFRNVMFFHEGLLLMEKGEFEKAQDTLAPLAREGGAGEELRIALGMSVLRRVPSTVPGEDLNLRRLLLAAGHAEELNARQKQAEARTEYERLTADFPTEVNVHYAFARFLLATREPDTQKILSAFEREIGNFPEHVLARLGIAALKATYDPAGGLRYAEEAVKLNPHIPLGHYLLGSLLLHTDQTARAIQELETARQSLPDEPRIYYALGRAYARANRPKDAEAARATFKRLNERK